MVVGVEGARSVCHISVAESDTSRHFSPDSFTSTTKVTIPLLHPKPSMRDRSHDPAALHLQRSLTWETTHSFRNISFSFSLLLLGTKVLSVHSCQSCALIEGFLITQHFFFVWEPLELHKVVSCRQISSLTSRCKQKQVSRAQPNPSELHAIISNILIVCMIW